MGGGKSAILGENCLGAKLVEWMILGWFRSSLVPRPHPLMRRNGLVNQSQISWACAHFCDSVTWQLSKTFYAKPAQKRYGYSSRFKNFTVVREVLVIITNLAISLVITTFGE